jgi:hypothetical protein
MIMPAVTKVTAANKPAIKIKIRSLLIGFTNIPGRKILVSVFIKQLD